MDFAHGATLAGVATASHQFSLPLPKWFLWVQFLEVFTKLGVSANFLAVDKDQRCGCDAVFVFETVGGGAGSKDMFLNLVAFLLQKIARGGAVTTGITGEFHAVEDSFGHWGTFFVLCS
jgi:hypothetical protein